MRRPGEAWGGGTHSHDLLRTHGRIGGYGVPECPGRWNRTIGKARPLSGRTENKFVAVIPVYKLEAMTAQGIFSEDSEMRLFIVGATGGIGEQLVEQALARGHRVTAFVRSPEKVGRTHERLTIVGGDPLDAEQLR